jgi:hypothetical protein
MVSGGRRLARRIAADRPLASGLVVGLAALALYGRTLMPGLHFWDTAEFQAIGPVLGIAHPTGYPSYTLLAWLGSVVLQPFGDAALRANLLSALLAAGSAGLAAGLVTRLTGRAVVGVAAGAALAVAPTAWSVGLRADAHALHFLLAALLLVLLVGWAGRVADERAADRWLVAAAVVYGVALGNHALTLLLAPGIAAFVLLAQPTILWRRARLVLTCAAALVVTTVTLYAYLPIRSAMDPPLDYANPQTLDGFRYLVFAEQFRGTFQEYPPLVEAVQLIGRETVEQLGILAALAVVGAVVTAVRRPGLFALLALWFGFTWAFALGYVNADIDRYHLVPTLAVVVLAGLGAGAIWNAVARRLPPVRSSTALPRVLAAVLAAVVLVGPSLAAVPDRFDRVDQSGERSARQWVEALLPQLEPNAVVVSWWSYSTPLWYVQFVEGRRQDVFVVDDRTVLDRNLGSAVEVVESNLGVRPVYLVRPSSEIRDLERRFVLVPLPDVTHSPVYRVDGRR